MPKYRVRQKKCTERKFRLVPKNSNNNETKRIFPSVCVLFLPHPVNKLYSWIYQRTDFLYFECSKQQAEITQQHLDFLNHIVYVLKLFILLKYSNVYRLEKISLVSRSTSSCKKFLQLKRETAAASFDLKFHRISSWKVRKIQINVKILTIAVFSN